MERAILEQRLLANRRIDDNGCWIWTKSCQPKGYGQTSMPNDPARRNLRVHRVAAWLWLGFDLDSALLVLHSCDTPRCFNPEHLFIGTAHDNTADMCRKGRNRFVTRRGEEVARSKLTEADVLAIRADVATNGRPYGTLRRLARQFGVSDTAIGYVLSGRNWHHVA